MFDPVSFNLSKLMASLQPDGQSRSASLPPPGQAPGAQALLADLQRIVEGGQALDLRAARLLAWLRCQDLAPLGYSSFTAFCRERVEWGGSWLRSLMALTT